MELRVFQKRFIRGAFAPGIDCACLSLPRGNGKSWLAGHLLTRCMSPGDPLHQSGAEYLLLAASLEQARIAFRFTRGDLEPCGDYRFIDSVTRLGITHKPSNTKLRVLSSNSKSAFGIVGCPLLLADEPGAWETTGGQLMADAILTAQGKPGSALRVIFIGTLAPATGGWWHDLVAGGTNGTTYVQRLMGDPEKWDQFSEIQALQSINGNLGFIPGQAARRTRQGAARFAAKGSISELPVEYSNGGCLNHAPDDP